MKRVATPEHEHIVGVVQVVRLAVAAVEVETVIVAIHLEDRGVAVRVGDIYTKPSTPLSIECSLDCILFCILNAKALYTEYLHFFKISYITCLCFLKNKHLNLN